MPSSACSKGETSARWWSSWFEPPRLRLALRLASLASTLQTPQRGGWSKQVAVTLDGWKHRSHEGDFNVYNAVCGVACTVAARIFRLPRCGWADSPVADHSGDFFGDSLL